MTDGQNNVDSRRPASADSVSDKWLASLASGSRALGALLNEPVTEQRTRGYRHTLREICQQPATWMGTVERVAPARNRLIGLTPPVDRGRHGAVVFTGSGSSLYVGECSRATLGRSIGIPVGAIAGGSLLTDGAHLLPPAEVLLVVSIARSGNSPESAAVIDRLLDERPTARHLIFTCCAEGRLATSYQGIPRVLTLVLDEATCDKSLVMTSSFTNLLLASRALAYPDRWPEYERRAARLASSARHLLVNDSDRIADVAASAFSSAVFLGSGDRAAGAREAALKMLELTAGRVRTLAETYLGVRHGPMSAIHPDTLVVAFLSSDPLTRAYEVDLLDELIDKGLGHSMVIVGTEIPGHLIRRRPTVAIDVAGDLDDGDLVFLDVLTGQLLGFFACLRFGLSPDSPSPAGVITRVVKPFRIHHTGQP